ncbi:hypothetical protein [Candidatus Frankia nodulisporulans]|uniref:hypothetical protein n=1 Tax=Candidatus Frankia nodulisporulans TaxID=2060052 RepID=UPI001C2ED35D|nr:hypothetical protein [Candidatus Frankia nodulisporulans]
MASGEALSVRRAELPASVRRLRAQIAVNARLATEDPVAMTVPARRAFLSKFESLADPDGVLPPEERARRATHLRKQHMQRLALRSVQARRRAAGGLA